MRTRQRTLAVVALATVVVAWFVGLYRHETDISPFLKQVLPQADTFERCDTGIYTGIEGAERRTVGYVAIGEAGGYGGPMRVAVGVDLTGNVERIAIVDHRETAAYFQRVLGSGLLEDLQGKRYSDPFQLDRDVDAVTGATMTADAVAQSVCRAARNVAGDRLNLPLPPLASTPIKFGLPEITLLSLYGLAFAGYTGRLKRKRLLRWVSLVTGLVVLGFLYNAPLTLTNVNSLLMGYWPGWQSHVYWYLLIGGVLIVPAATGRNPYCNGICPFGAAQRCLAVAGGAKPRISPRYRAYLRWAPRILAWAAILLALVYRNPALANYEVYGALFDVVGSYFLFGLLAIVLVASLFIRRPWCNYLCPIRAVVDYLRFGRKWVRSTLR